jgi:hypothetical protein
LERSRKIVKKEDYLEAYSVVFDDIPPHFSADDLSEHPNNHLLS